jgi:hypothetical protein
MKVRVAALGDEIRSDSGRNQYEIEPFMRAIEALAELERWLEESRLSQAREMEEECLP